MSCGWSTTVDVQVVFCCVFLFVCVFLSWWTTMFFSPPCESSILCGFYQFWTIAPFKNPYDLCMVYFLTFGWFLWYMYLNIPWPWILSFKTFYFLLPDKDIWPGARCSLFEEATNTLPKTNSKINGAMNKKTWLFRLYRGLYYPIIWGF